MNLFNYLMAKKGHNTSVRDDLLAYLLGKRTPKEVKTATGTTISITDVTREKIVSLTLSKESTQDSVAYVDVGAWEQGNINGNNGNNESSSTRIRTKDYIPIKSNILYTFTRTIATSYNTYRFYDNNKTYLGNNTNIDITSSLSTENMQGNELIQQITINDTRVKYIRIVDLSNDLSTVYTISTENTPSPDYPQEVKTVKGSVGITITDGTNTRNYTIPLGNNEIAGIGDYKDELIVDKNGHCYLNKFINKKIFDGTENFNYSTQTNSVFYIQSITDFLRSQFIPFCNNYHGTVKSSNASSASSKGDNTLSFTSSISSYYLYIVDNRYDNRTDFINMLLNKYNSNEPVILYYPLATPQLIDLNYTVDIELFKGINNISNSDDMNMVLKYY